MASSPETEKIPAQYVARAEEDKAAEVAQRAAFYAAQGRAAGLTPSQLYPDCATSRETRSCTGSFNRVWACHSPGNYFTAYYRTGGFADCSAAWSAIAKCNQARDTGYAASLDDAETVEYLDNHSIFVFRPVGDRPPPGFCQNIPEAPSEETHTSPNP